MELGTPYVCRSLCQGTAHTEFITCDLRFLAFQGQRGVGQGRGRGSAPPCEGVVESPLAGAIPESTVSADLDKERVEG